MILAPPSARSSALVLYGIAVIGPERLDRFPIRYGKWFRLTLPTSPGPTAGSTGARPGGADLPLHPAAAPGVDPCRLPSHAARPRHRAHHHRLGRGTPLIGAGYALRSRWHRAEPVLNVFQYVVLAAIAVAVVWFVWTRLAPTPASVKSPAECLTRG